MKRAVVLFALAIAACSPGRVETTAAVTTGAARRAPAQVIVSAFAVSPGQVSLDSGVLAERRRERGSVPPSVIAAGIAERAQAALVETLVKRLTEYGLPVQRRSAAITPARDSLLVQGQITSINMGNRTRRVMIGLGSGASSVDANAQLYYAADPAHPAFVRSFSGTADSGHMPGAAETMGVGAVAGSAATSAAVSAGLHAGAEMRRTDEEALADKLAVALAEQIGDYAVSEGWIPASAVH